MSSAASIQPDQLQSIGYTYDEATDKWSIGDAAADYVYTASAPISFALPGTLKNIVNASIWDASSESQFPIFDLADFVGATSKSTRINFVMVDC